MTSAHKLHSEVTMDLLLKAFIPLFVAIDVFGVLPFFISMTENVGREQKRKLITQAIFTALTISILFLFAGQAIFGFLGISEADFRIAGGILLLVLAIRDISSDTPLEGRGGSKDPAMNESVGVVPIGIPLTVGPAALTTIMISAETHGVAMTLAALLLNLAIVWAVFRKSDFLQKIISKSGARAIAKVMALFLAAIGIMMIRMGYKDLFFS